MARRADYGVVFFFHGLGDSHARYLNDLAPAARAHRLLLVLPEGFGEAPSWNGGACCGEARDAGLDDVGLVGRITSDLEEALPRFAPQRKLYYGMGHSNGGFLASFAQVEGRPFRAIATLAGHHYVVGSSPTPVILHHSRRDDVVRYDGCCADGRAQHACCCDIGARHGVTCAGADLLFARWGAANGCDPLRPPREWSLDGNATRCRAHRGCAAATTLCTLDDAAADGQYDWLTHVQFPPSLFDRVFSFFAADAAGHASCAGEASESSVPSTDLTEPPSPFPPASPSEVFHSSAAPSGNSASSPVGTLWLPMPPTVDRTPEPTSHQSSTPTTGAIYPPTADQSAAPSKVPESKGARNPTLSPWSSDAHISNGVYIGTVIPIAVALLTMLRIHYQT